MKENNRVRGKIPEMFSPLMIHHLDAMDEALSPGLTVIKWTSLNLSAFVESATSSLNNLELLIDQAVGIHEDRINVIFHDILSIPLCELPQTETLTVEEFVAATTQLSVKAGEVIDMKSQIIERAVQELISLLVGPEVVLQTPEDDSSPGAIAMTRKIEQRAKLMHEADNLFECYEQRNIDTQMRLMKTSLEAIRKRISVPMQSYSDRSPNLHPPFFKADITLVLPSIVMTPSLDEIQQGLNQAVSSITGLTKQVLRWGQQRHVPVPPEGQRPLHSRSDLRSRSRVVVIKPDTATMKNYHRAVSENKEILKVVSALSTAINSTKRIVDGQRDHFVIYSHLWNVDRETKMEEYLASNPGVYEFSNEMQQYAELEGTILAEPETIAAGAICLHSEKIKLALCMEAKGWSVCFGRAMNQKYQRVMEEVSGSIEDWCKRLNRPLNDLDDIREVMAALKDIRQNEIRIDMSLDPIEVGVA